MRTAPQIRTSLVPVDGWVKFNCARCDKELWKTPYEPTQCWMFEHLLSDGGYGRLKVAGKMIHAHRLSWEIHRGPIPEGMLVLHKCIATRPCVNPDHLYVGSQQDNIDDVYRQGRQNPVRGEKAPWAVLTEAQVLEIKPLKGIVSSKELADKYKCSRSAIHHIWYGYNWKHLNQPLTDKSDKSSSGSAGG
jgi:hypothetical protein